MKKYHNNINLNTVMIDKKYFPKLKNFNYKYKY